MLYENKELGRTLCTLFYVKHSGKCFKICTKYCCKENSYSCCRASSAYYVNLFTIALLCRALFYWYMKYLLLFDCVVIPRVDNVHKGDSIQLPIATPLEHTGSSYDAISLLTG